MCTFLFNINSRAVSNEFPLLDALATQLSNHSHVNSRSNQTLRIHLSNALYIINFIVFLLKPFLLFTERQFEQNLQENYCHYNYCTDTALLPTKVDEYIKVINKLSKIIILFNNYIKNRKHG